MAAGRAPLSPRQQRAAHLLGQGLAVKDVANEVGVSKKTLSSRWKAREDFRVLVRRSREALVGDTDTAEAVLTAALAATRRDGTPDWQTRVAAARTLMTSPVASPAAEAKARETRIYVPPDKDDAA